MDDDLRIELNALREAKAADQRLSVDAQSKGMDRLRQFVKEMQTHDVHPFPLVQLRYEAVPGTPAAPGGLFRKARPAGPKTVTTRYALVDHAWPIGFSNIDGTHTAPMSARLTPAITAAGVLWSFDWQGIAKTGPTTEERTIPREGLFRLPADYNDGMQTHYLRATKIIEKPNYETFGAAAWVAELIHDYLEGPNVANRI